MRVRASATLIVRDLFSAFMADPSAMGEKHRHAGIEDLPVHKRARKVRDYLAGMTDTYAIAAHRRLFDHTPDLR
jgi:dGTPase